ALAPLLGLRAAAHLCPGVRSPVGRAAGRRPGDGRAGMTEPLRIAVVSPVCFPVPPTGYGGIEWIVWLLADGLVDAGHDVTLFASGDSHTRAKLEGVFPTAPSEYIGRSFWELRHILSAYTRSGEFDVVNDHTGMTAI